MGSVSLGLPGDLVRGDGDWDCLTDCFLCKMGGRPVLPAAADVAQSSVTCRECKQDLVLVAQVSDTGRAAEGGEGDFVLCVFACPGRACSRAWKEWKALRVQVNPDADEASAPESDTTAEQDPADATEKADANCGGEDDWWNDTSWNDAGTSDSDMFGGGPGTSDTTDLDIVEALQQASLSSSKGKKPSKTKPGKILAENRVPECKPVPTARAFPAFYLHFAPEPRPSESRVSKLDLRVRELVEAFEEENGERARGAADKGHEAPSSASNGANGDRGDKADKRQQRGAKGVGKGAPSWTQEQYESEPADEKQFHKFLDRLNLEPTQCVRWYRDRDEGGFLWPSKRHPMGIPPCERCGSPRRVRMQVMGTSSAYLSEAVEWAKGPSGGAYPSAEEADFITVAVYTCSRACGLGQGGVQWEHCRVEVEE